MKKLALVLTLVALTLITGSIALGALRSDGAGPSTTDGSAIAAENGTAVNENLSPNSAAQSQVGPMVRTNREHPFATSFEGYEIQLSESVENDAATARRPIWCASAPCFE
ncbi:MAG TPA: hypothetical protein VGR87_05800 [Candidatus Limnocylindria bacterium]|jgi:hypothetical protein|nr:hypothetical protein [Candidatus Limnocylindria bacterium]